MFGKGVKVWNLHRNSPCSLPLPRSSPFHVDRWRIMKEINSIKDSIAFHPLSTVHNVMEKMEWNLDILLRLEWTRRHQNDTRMTLKGGKKREGWRREKKKAMREGSFFTTFSCDFSSFFVLKAELCVTSSISANALLLNADMKTLSSDTW